MRYSINKYKNLSSEIYINLYYIQWIRRMVKLQVDVSLSYYVNSLTKLYTSFHHQYRYDGPTNIYIYICTALKYLWSVCPLSSSL